MHDRSACACINVGVSIDICRGSKERLNVVCVDTERYITYTELWGCWPCKTDPGVCKIERKRCRKFIYRPAARSMDGFIDPVHPCASIYSSISLSVYLSVYLSVHPSIYVSICQSIHPSKIDRFINISIFPSFHPSSSPSVYLSSYLCNRLSACLSVYLSIESTDVSIDLSIHPSIYLAIYLSICPSPDAFFDLWIHVPTFNLSIYPSSCLFI